LSTSFFVMAVLGPSAVADSLEWRGAMHRRPWPVAVLLLAVIVAVAGCARSPESDPEQLADELAQVKADRDQLAVLVRQLSTTSATLEQYTVNDRQHCLDTLQAVRRRMQQARAALAAGSADTRNAASHLRAASEALGNALDDDCAPATP
jgi:hypothetical protein